MRSTTLAAALALAALIAPSAHARLVFSAQEAGISRIEVVQPDGSGRARLGGGPWSDAMPSWSPDGTRIAFASDRDASGEDRAAEIYVMNVDGSGARRLTRHAADDTLPAWSPDGTRIAFTRVTGSDLGVYVMDAAGGGERRVSGTLQALGAAWAPDGRRLAFGAFRGDSPVIDLYVMDLGDALGLGAQPPRLLARDAHSPAWSPDGRRIAFAAPAERPPDVEFPATDIWLMNADGSDRTRLTADPADDGAPAWSPDGRSIAFQSERFYRRGQSPELWVMGVEGACPTRITAGAPAARGPAWDPLAPLASAPCGPLPLEYTEADLAAAERWSAFRLLFLGRTFDDLALTSAQELGNGEFGFFYDDCRRASGRCRPPMTVQVRTVCRDHPLRRAIGGSRHFEMRSALVEQLGDEVRVYTGGITVTVTGARRGRSEARRLVATLRPLGQDPRLLEPLGPPVFPRAVLSRLRRVELTVRRYGIEGARRRLRLSRSALRQRVRLARTIRSLPRPTRSQRRAARC